MAETKRVVITGAAGFAGYSLTMELLSRGFEVYAVLRPNSTHNKRFDGCLGNFHPIELDSHEFDRIHERIDAKCDSFYHLAWFGGRDEFDAQKANIDNTLKALKSAAKLGCKRFVCTGSQAEYGVVEERITEDLTPNPFSAYGAAKVAAMYLTRRQAQLLGIEWIWGRIFSLYGDYEPSGRMLPDLLGKLSRNEEVHLTSCEQNWDYLHVLDAVRAIADIGEKGKSGEIYNIANGNYKPLKQFVECAKKTLNSGSKIVYGDRAIPFVSLQPDVSKIKRDTGWEPEMSFIDGIKRFAERL